MSEIVAYSTAVVVRRYDPCVKFTYASHTP